MSKKTFASALAILLIIALTVPAIFFIAPQRASAQSVGSCIVGLAAGLGLVTANHVVAVPTADAAGGTGSWTTAGSTVGNCLYSVIVVPILRAMIRAILQAITQSTINWINGANGTGQPSFVQNLAVHLQSVGDVAALSLIAQIGQNTAAFNSPFGAAIALALQSRYAQQTSLAGFYAANQCTLAKSSPNVAGFLGGEWSQGGAAAWFALTTQNQNNPYTLYLAAQSQLGSNVSQVQTNRKQDLMQSGGFLSWCPPGATANTTSSSVGVKPQAPCTNANGTPAMAQTPGSTIKSYLDTNLGSGIGQLVSAQDLDAALGAIVTALGNRVIGSTGLFGSSQPSGSRNITVVAPAPSSSAASAISLAQSTLTQLATYTSAWNTISAAANTASMSVTALLNSCSAQQTIAQTALTNEIAPMLVQAQAALNSAATTQALALQVQAEASAVPIADPVQLSTDVTSLSSMPPAAGDVVNAQLSAAVTGAATANPAGSLTVSGGTFVDQMNLISTNAAALETSSCATPSAPAVSSPTTIYNAGVGG
ncbi:MAG: hypothetical protein ABSB00_01640 [Minisyncoccia bacterium]|jgi:hypothetical protein